MRTLTGLTVTCGLLIAASIAAAQRPDRDPDLTPSPNNVDGFVNRMMTFDKNKDGQLTKNEISDERLHRLFDRADLNNDGTVTKKELSTLAVMEPANDRGGPGGGPPGFGPPGGRGGPGFGPGGGMGFGRPGEVLSTGLQQRLQLSAEQKTQLADLQKDVDARLAKILSSEQKAQLAEMRQRGPGGFGPPGGGGRPGGFGPPREQAAPGRSSKGVSTVSTRPQT